MSTVAITTEIVDVDPRLAEEWLGKNAHNRDLRNRDVTRYATAMERDEWTMNGDAIRFDVNGNLMDGQHRLWAVIESGKTVTMLVIRGLPVESQETMDVGVRRSLRDALRLRGESNHTRLAASVSYHWKWTEGTVRIASSRPSIQQAIAHLNKHPELRNAPNATNKLLRRIRMSSAMIDAVWYELRALDADATDVFFETLATGVALQQHDPRLVLRAWLERQSFTQAGSRASALVTHAMILKAWNMWRDGQQTLALSWKTTGVGAEAFPVPR